MARRDGFILLHRQSIDRDGFKHAARTLAWIDLLTLTNHEDAVVTVSYGFLAFRWGISKSTAHDWVSRWVYERSLERLPERSSERNAERFFVVNYAKYQQPTERSSERRSERRSERSSELKKQVTSNKSVETNQLVAAADAATPAGYALKFFRNDHPTTKAEAEYFVGRGASPEVVREQFVRFMHYWGELTPGGKKQRWQTEKTFEVRKRLVTWFDRIEQRKQSSTKPHVHIS